MIELKKWDEINKNDGELYQRKVAAISKAVNDFHNKVKGDISIISAEEVYNLCDKHSFFSTSIWYNKIAFNSQRKSKPVIFGLKSGIVFKENFVYVLWGNGPSDYWEIEIVSFFKNPRFNGNRIHGYDPLYSLDSNPGDIGILKKIVIFLNEIKNDFNKQTDLEILKQNEKLKNQQEQLNINKKNEILNFDKDGDGKIDLIDNDFSKLVSKNQKKVISIDKNYVHQFVKVSNFIKTKKQNTQKIFESIRDTSNDLELKERVNLLRNQIHSYELLVYHSVNMIGALVSEDLITFYEIYESFDKLGIFNSNWENEVSEKLTNIGDKLDDILYSIYRMEQKIVSELNNLSYVTQESFEHLNSSVTSQLREVESSINTNNLLTGIQAYQLYKINSNTKGLRS